MSTKLRIIMLFIIMLVGVAYAYASESERHMITHDDFSFILDVEVGKNINIVSYVGDSPQDAAPGFTDAPYTQFLFYGDDSSLGFLFDQGGGIRLYETEDLAEYDFMQAIIEELDQLLSDQSDLQSYMDIIEDNSNALPFLPLMLHGQTVKARAQYIETNYVRGIEFITTSQAAAEPFLNNQFFYTFQGLSTDGQYYVSMVIPLTTELFPAEIPVNFDMATFVDTLPQYLADSVEMLNNATASDFAPNLETVDDLIESIRFAQ